MKKFLTVIFTSVFILLVAAPVTVTTLAPTASAASSNCDTSILGIPPWYRGLTNVDCTIISPTDPSVGGIQNFIWRIVLNGIQIALFLAAYLAAFFILYGGFLFITGGSNPSQIEKGRKSIFNAVIGLVIAMSAIAITNFIFNIIGPVSPNQGIVQLSSQQLLANALNIVYFIAGTVAVIVIIISGINYTTSAGDSGKITKAKNMLTYSIVGLIVVLVAFVITSFVIGRFS